MLTGKTQFRTNWRGQLILQVEHKGSVWFNTGRSIEYDGESSVFRDATVEDLQKLNISCEVKS